MRGTIQERFEAKFTKFEDCWEWEACKNDSGYGMFNFSGQTRKAHRVAYQFYVGEIPEGMCVCHQCDNPGCVNPAHLFLGTKFDNNKDCESKGRGVGKGRGESGERHHGAKLTNMQAIGIRARYSNGERGVDLAKEFGVSRATISMIVRKRTWRNI